MSFSGLVRRSIRPFHDNLDNELTDFDESFQMSEIVRGYNLLVLVKIGKVGGGRAMGKRTINMVYFNKYLGNYGVDVFGRWTQGVDMFRSVRASFIFFRSVFFCLAFFFRSIFFR